MRQYVDSWRGWTPHRLTAMALWLSCGFAGSAHAGYTLMTNPVWISAPRETARPFAVNDLFWTGEFGTFSEIYRDSAYDLNIQPADLVTYRYTLSGQVIAASNESVVYSGEYEVFIVLGHIRIADVSAGSFLLSAEFQSPSRAILRGDLIQDPGRGPGDPSLPDLSYGGFPIEFSGVYEETLVGVGGLLEGEFRQDAIPSPATALLLGVTGFGFATRRRRR